MTERIIIQKKYLCKVCNNDKGATLHLYGKGYCKVCKEFTSTINPCESCDYKKEYGIPCYGEPCTIGYPKGE